MAARKKDYNMSIRCYFPGGGDNKTQHYPVMPLKDIAKWVEAYEFTHPRGALPFLPRLFRERFTGQGIEQLPEGRTENQFRTTGDKGNEKVFVTDFLGHIVDTDTPTDFFSLDEEGQQGGLNEIDMTGQLTNFDIHVQTLGEEIHIKLVRNRFHPWS